MSGKPELVLIAALARNGVIGRDNALPWRLRKDLLHFRALTMGSPILMGRNTWESLGRPLPGRRNIVLSRRPDFCPPGAERAASLDEALELTADTDKLFVIGGAELYRRTLAYADRLLLTEVDADVDGDTLFPPWPRDRFREVGREHHEADADNEHPFDFAEYVRITPV